MAAASFATCACETRTARPGFSAPHALPTEMFFPDAIAIRLPTFSPSEAACHLTNMRGSQLTIPMPSLASLPTLEVQESRSRIKKTALPSSLMYSANLSLVVSFALMIARSLHRSYLPFASRRLLMENRFEGVQNGVRGLLLDMYDFLGDIWLCHSFGGVCYNFTAFEPAINTLKEIEVFLSYNPTEIVTIFIEDYVRSTKGLTKVFTAAGLMKFWFPVSNMPKNGEDWPTVTDMVANNHRLLVFTSNRSKEANEGIAYNWRYVNENQYGNGGLQAGKCPNRAESELLNATSRSLVMENFFPDDPVEAEACKYNSAPLMQMLPVCYQAAGKRWANFLAVDFYRRSDGGGTFAALDVLNAGLICGCSDINVCKLNLQYGVCNASVPQSLPQPATQQATQQKETHRVSCAYSVSRASFQQMWALTFMSFLWLL